MSHGRLVSSPSEKLDEVAFEVQERRSSGDEFGTPGSLRHEGSDDDSAAVEGLQ